jgi:hypothetical protein
MFERRKEWSALTVLALLMLSIGSFNTLAQGRLQLTPDKSWTVEQTTSSMRVAQYRLPMVKGDAEDASLIVYFFGGGGGSVQANLDRWLSQISQPDGSNSKDKAKITNSTSNGLKITLLDVSGVYQAETAPGSGQRLNKPSYRMLASVVETTGGPYFIKLVGPTKTVDKWRRSFDTFLTTIQFK